MADLFQVVDDLDNDKQELVANRLEIRAEMPLFASIRKSYFDRLGLLSEKHIHELGCGTGAICRAVAEDPSFKGEISGSDLSASLVNQARALAKEAGLESIQFFQADGQGSDIPAGAYYVVLAHTVFSHVAEPTALVREMKRLARPGGRLVIHDADFSSVTFGSGNAELDRKMPKQYLDVICQSPYVMHEMPKLLKQFGLQIEEAFGDVVLETGTGTYFPAWAENFGPLAIAGGFATEADVLSWNKSIAAALDDRTFYGACNYMTYSVRVPE
ncbi:MAG: methyltransferase domain-containing protein [Chloroflexota bacterium]